MGDLVRIVIRSHAIAADEDAACIDEILFSAELLQSIHNEIRKIIHLAVVFVAAREVLPSGNSDPLSFNARLLQDIRKAFLILHRLIRQGEIGSQNRLRFDS